MKVSAFFRRHIVALLSGICFIFSPTTLFAASAPAAAPPPDTETRSLILGVDAGTAPAANADRKKALAGLLNRGRQTAQEKTRNRLLELGKFGLGFDLVRTPAGFVQILQQQEILRKQRELEATVQRPADAERYKVETLANATNASLIVSGVSLQDAGGYQAVVGNPFGSATS